MIARIPILVFDTCAFCAALFKGVQQLRGGFLRGSSLMRIILRDSLAYFIMSVCQLLKCTASALSALESDNVLIDSVDTMLVIDLVVWFHVRVRSWFLVAT